MFKRRNNRVDIGDIFQDSEKTLISEQADLPEWEEVTDELTEKEHPISKPVVYSESNSDNDLFDLSAFPAMQMARRAIDHKQPENSTHIEEEYFAEANGENELSQLVRRYADIENENKNSDPDLTDLPALFRQGTKKNDRTNELPREEVPDTQAEDFVMATELEKQKEISGELFDFIDCIVSNTEQMSDKREQTIRESAKEIVVDPYNTTFNDRFDDTEEILNTTAEISLAPKYKMEG